MLSLNFNFILESQVANWAVNNDEIHMEDEVLAQIHYLDTPEAPKTFAVAPTGLNGHRMIADAFRVCAYRTSALV